MRSLLQPFKASLSLSVIACTVMEALRDTRDCVGPRVRSFNLTREKKANPLDSAGSWTKLALFHLLSNKQNRNSCPEIITQLFEGQQHAFVCGAGGAH